MIEIVVDASVVANWFFDEKKSHYSQAVLSEIETGAKMLVPSIWILEVFNVLLTHQKRGQMGIDDRKATLVEIQRLPLNFAPSLRNSDWSKLLALAQQYGLTSYDAEYLRIAKEYNRKLGTEDKLLRAAAKAEGVFFEGK